MIDASTLLHCIIGNPVRHSFSPAMHNAAFQELSMNSAYVAFEVSDLENAVKGIRALGIRGASVTIPHKVEVLKYLDEVEPIARHIGSANTIVNDDGKLTGTNTDGFGFYRALSEKESLDGKNIAVFGAGGAARAVIFSAFYYGKPAKLRVFTLESEMNSARSLSQNVISNLELEQNRIENYTLQEWTDYQDQSDIIINTTPLGMHPHTDKSILQAEDIPENATVMDLVYHPHETRFIRNAQSRGCKIAYGIDMLLYQGIKQFELWTGQKAPEEVMRKILLERIAK